jgi:GT2 family glycosyltransferase
MVKVSIIIKALNEEANVARAISSCLAAAAPYAGEVILADSGSTDRTVDIAMQFPVTIVQLQDASEQCCGIGPQLGYQHSHGEYVYIIDCDMALDPEFLRIAIEFLDQHPAVGGVGGAMREMRTENLETQGRRRRRNRHQADGVSNVRSLDGGGLYRRTAIEEVGYFSDRNLHAFEEYNLGVRLRRKGWQLIRLPAHAFDHYGYSIGAYPLLWRRIRTRYFLGTGEALRAAIEDGHSQNILTELRAVRVYGLVLALWTAVLVALLLAVSGTWAIVLVSTACLLPVVAMTVVTRSISLGLYSVIVWHVFLVGLIAGALRARKPPTSFIRSRVVHAAAQDPSRVQAAAAL